MIPQGTVETASFFAAVGEIRFLCIIQQSDQVLNSKRIIVSRDLVQFAEMALNSLKVRPYCFVSPPKQVQPPVGKVAARVAPATKNP